jgi:hypothetical protein
MKIVFENGLPDHYKLVIGINLKKKHVAVAANSTGGPIIW